MTFAIVYRKLVKNKDGKYVYDRKHESFTGTWEELEQYLEENCLMLEAWDYVE